MIYSFRCSIHTLLWIFIPYLSRFSQGAHNWRDVIVRVSHACYDIESVCLSGVTMECSSSGPFPANVHPRGCLYSASR